MEELIYPELTCEGLDCLADRTAAKIIVVSGCLTHDHVNVRYFCETHWQQIESTIETAEGLVCIGCVRQYKELNLADDYIVDRI